MENLNKIKEVVKKLLIGIKAIPQIGAKILKESGQILFVTFLIVGLTAFVVNVVIIGSAVGKWVSEAKSVIEMAMELRGIEPEIREKAVMNAQKAQKEISVQKETVTTEGLKKYFLNGNEAKAEETKAPIK